MIYNLPLRFTTLHLAQRFLIDAETFMITNLLTGGRQNNCSSQSPYYT
jgi:hypothetical protein